ncbi:hypothetical protein J2Y58_001691 [Sphingomonas sp. BE138]|uniref:STAS/SEC14 domain-containing protein n=1 Tax=Sphingomonas sp. BE138 TaxID=2817845 RepID=UPI00285F2792|nr:STAS/SEC14 domain-containing protein [Sphingomonas sp. BE138]MDR6788333.1 hypothetical protein [Sphingomonas sp. BE138]
MYDVSFDQDAHLLAIRWHRIFTPAEVATYTQDVMRGFLAARFRPGYRLMIDMSACGPQPQDTLAAFARHMAPFPKASRIAIVAVGAILRTQVRRVMTQPYMQVFDDPATARAWLTA